MKEKDPEKVKAIFSATLELAGSIGIAGLKMSDIAKKANIASGTLYIYFSSKDELLNSLYRNLKVKHSYLNKNTQDESEPLKVRMKNIWDKALKYRMENYNEVIFLEQFYYSPFMTKESKEVSEKSLENLFLILEEGKKHMIIKNMDNNLLMSFLSGFLKEMASFCLVNNIEVNDKFLSDTFSLCWDALKA